MPDACNKPARKPQPRPPKPRVLPALLVMSLSACAAPQPTVIVSPAPRIEPPPQEAMQTPAPPGSYSSRVRAILWSWRQMLTD